MNIALCAIAKMENHYIREWVEHYKSLCFDKVFLYDNNDLNGERFEEVINDYIQSKYVDVIDFRGKKMCQLEAYNDCYLKNSNDFDWIAFFDIDEFLIIDNIPYKRNIKNLVSNSKFDSYCAIKLYWKNMTDNGLVSVKDNNYSVNRFTEACEDKYHNYNKYCKCIVRTKQDLEYKSSVHYPDGIEGKICYISGYQSNEKNQNKGPFAIWRHAYILHYRFKTIEEYITNKMQRLYPDHSEEDAKKLLNLNTFFRLNKKTKEKVDFAKELLKKYL